MTITLVLTLALAGLLVFLHFALRPEEGADDRATQRLRDLHRQEVTDRARTPGHPAPKLPLRRRLRQAREQVREQVTGVRARDVLDRVVEPGVTGPGAVPIGVPSAGDPYRRPTAPPVADVPRRPGPGDPGPSHGSSSPPSTPYPEGDGDRAGNQGGSGDSGQRAGGADRTAPGGGGTSRQRPDRRR